MNIIKFLKGSIEEKKEQCIRLGIFDEYNRIFLKYSIIDNIEALKRAIFIQWYGASEPEIYTGICNLDRVVEEKNLKKVNELILNKCLDNEFKIMLVFYNSVIDWYFASFNNIEELKTTICKSNKVDINQITFMHGRGQMGEYWNSLKKS